MSMYLPFPGILWRKYRPRFFRAKVFILLPLGFSARYSISLVGHIYLAHVDGRADLDTMSKN
jgi:hypothetical protein